MGEVYKHDPLVSVIMNGYNCEQYLRESIDSVFAQTYLNWEIIFWDNGSIDDTGSIATSYNSKLRYFRSETNVTLGAARNSALQKVHGEFITFLDTDDYWFPHKLSQQVAVMQGMMEVDFIYTNFYNLNQSTGRMRKGLKKEQPSGDVFGQFLKFYPVNLQTVMFRYTALTSLDEFFDERLTLNEEFDLFMRILYNSSAYYMDSITAAYRIHPNMSSFENIERYPIESTLCLDKFLAISPHINNRYSENISIFRAKIAFWRARGYMYNNNPSEARRALKDYYLRQIKFFLLFLATYNQVIWRLLLDINMRTK